MLNVNAADYFLKLERNQLRQSLNLKTFHTSKFDGDSRERNEKWNKKYKIS